MEKLSIYPSRKVVMQDEFSMPDINSFLTGPGTALITLTWGEIGTRTEEIQSFMTILLCFLPLQTLKFLILKKKKKKRPTVQVLPSKHKVVTLISGTKNKIK